VNGVPLEYIHESKAEKAMKEKLGVLKRHKIAEEKAKKEKAEERERIMNFKFVMTIRQFIEVLSASGILHGSIFSVSRLMMTMSLITLFNPAKHYVTLKDFNTAITIASFVISSLDVCCCRIDMIS